ncbi:hypothetical protein NVSP9465_00180 [Novosphingobium sp. CECT 9465]|nr:hypothetical protein NVSP9465_00180 [Novosphingobium sp. CECT 9465]
MSSHRDRRVTQHWAKIGPPLRGCSVRLAARVTSLARATSPRCTTLLGSEPHRAITVGQSYVIWL